MYPSDDYRRFRIVANGGCILIIVVSALSYIGWILNIQLLKNIFTGFPPMKANSAISFIVCATVLLLNQAQRQTSFGKNFILASALLSISISFGTLIEYFFNASFQLDSLFIKLAVSQNENIRMSPVTAINFIFVSIFIFGMERNIRFELLQVLILFIYTSSVFTIIYYLFEIKQIYAVTELNRMSFPTSISFIIMGTVLLLQHPDRGFIRYVTEKSITGALLRRLLPVAILTPIFLGWIRVIGQNAGLYEIGTGRALSVIIMIIIFLLTIVWNIRHIRQIEKQQHLIQEELENKIVSIKEYEERNNEIMHALISITQKDFSHKIKLRDRNDELDAIALGINIINEELGHYIEQLELANSEIKKGRERWDTFMNSTSQMFLIVNEYFLVENVNQTFLQYKQIKEKNDVLGKNICDLFSLNYLDQQNKYQKVMESGVPVTFYFQETTHLSGIRHFEISVFKMSNGLGLIVEDITAQKAAELEITQLNIELRQHVQQLETVNKELESFSYSISHDLRTPLRAIHGYTKILSDEYIQHLDEGALKLMQSIMQNSKRMGQLIDDLLEFSRMGRKELQKSVVNMSDIAHSALKQVLEANPKREQKITILPLLPAYADHALINQVFVNLISNAVKFSQLKDLPAIEIGSYKEGNEHIYYVKDNGVGFDMRYVGKLFGVFQRLHAFNEFEGTGVGLAFVQRIVLKHNGRIWADAALDKGATFFFSIPNTY